MGSCVMPMYYFHIRTHGELILDGEGSDLVGADHAEREALASAREICGQGIRSGEDRRGWAIVITRADGSVLRELLFGDTAKDSC
jgi:hypothetical protein